MKSAALKKSIFEARIKDRKAMAAAAKEMDTIRKKFGKPDKRFDAVALIRRMREAP